MGDGKRAVKRAEVWDLGLRDFAEVWELQRRLVSERQADAICDTLLLVEHPHVVTLGRRLRADQNVLVRDMPVFEIERGGDVTYHGPGQLVGYPILKLADDERDLHAYLRHLEEALFEVCASVGLEAGRNPGYTGAWLGPKKVASIGIAVRRWVTLHGFALNVSTELARFASINPCGLQASVMTSLSEAAGRPIELGAIKAVTLTALGRALGRDFQPVPPRG